MSAARHQQKVLVIDADLRCPRLHQFFHLNNQFGLANFLAGETDIPMIRQVSFLGERIDLITSGFRPSDPVKLLNSSRLQDLIEQEKQNYDLILVDTSPTKGMVDAVKVASCCDTSVLTIRLNKIKTSELHQANALLNKLNILGIVANDCPETTQKYGIPTEYLLPQQN